MGLLTGVSNENRNDILLKLFNGLEYFECLDIKVPEMKDTVTLDGECYDINNTKWYSIISFVLKNPVLIHDNCPSDIRIKMDWCRTVLDGRFDMRNVSFDSSKNKQYKFTHRFRFQYHSDAMAFKLCWAE